MTSNDKIIKNYIKQIRHHLPICKSNEKKYLNDLQMAIKDYANESNKVTYNDLYNYFGEPKILAANYLLEADSQYLSKEINYSKKLRLTMLIFSIIFLLSLILYIILLCTSYNKSQKAYISREIITIEEEKNEYK